jgi:ATP-dependent RNA helicase DDX35
MIASLEGRMYPVEVAYLRESTPDYVRTAAEVVITVHSHASPPAIVALVAYAKIRPQNGPGDILVFLTGREEIERCLQYLSEAIPQ